MDEYEDLFEPFEDMTQDARAASVARLQGWSLENLGDGELAARVLREWDKIKSECNREDKYDPNYVDAKTFVSNKLSKAKYIQVGGSRVRHRQRITDLNRTHCGIVIVERKVKYHDAPYTAPICKNCTAACLQRRWQADAALIEYEELYGY